MFKRQIHIQTEFKIEINCTGLYVSERASLCTSTSLEMALDTLILYSLFIIPETKVGSQSGVPGAHFCRCFS